MGTCPHCRAVTLPGDAVCYTCGRFLQGEGASYSMPNAPKKRGVVVDSKGRSRNIMKRRRNRQRSVFMLAFVIFAFLSPQAREAAFGTVDNLDTYLAQFLEGPLMYPVEASFGVDRSFVVENNLERPAFLQETVRLPLGGAPRLVHWQHDVTPCVEFPCRETKRIHQGSEHEPTGDAFGSEDGQVGVGLLVTVPRSIGEAGRT